MSASCRGVIVFGHPRSGTTLLRRLLSGHPDIAAPPETFLFDAAARFLHADLSAERTDIGVLAGLSFLGFDDDETLSRLRSLCFGFLEAFAAREGKSVWVEKTAFHAFLIPEIVRLCGEHVHYVGIVRHPFDVAASTVEFCGKMGTYPDALHRYIRQYNQPLQAFLASWRDVARELVTLGKTRPDRTILIRYEDLVAETEETVGAVLEAIGIEGGTAFLDGALGTVGTPGFSDHKAYRSTAVRSDMTDRWRELPAAQLSALAPMVADEIELFGYEPISGGPDTDHRLARRLYLHGLGFGANDG